MTVACFLLAAFFYIPKWFDSLFNSQQTSINVVSGVVIALATLANLASVGSKIVLEKDWIVVVAMDDPERLASMNAVFRTVDLTTLGRIPFYLRRQPKSMDRCSRALVYRGIQSVVDFIADNNLIYIFFYLDLQMLAPIIGGLLFDFVGYPFAAVFIAVWNLVSVIVEYTLLILIYRLAILKLSKCWH